MTVLFKMKNSFKPGDYVPESGIYNVIHSIKHKKKHQVTCIRGNKFPRCRHCGAHIKFSIIKRALHLSEDKELF